MNSTLTELWTSVNDPRYADTYSISTLGRIRREKEVGPNSTAGHILKPRLIRDYPSYRLYFRGKTKWHLAHRLVASAFIPNPDGKPQVNHKNGIKADSRVENLEWVSSSENRIHSYRVLNSRHAKGRDYNHAKLSEDSVREIRNCWEARSATQTDMAKKHGVSFQLISLVVNRKVWRHVA